jgi:hypothetical protein
MEPAVINVEILLKPVCVHVLIAANEMLVSVVCTMLQLAVDDHFRFYFPIYSKALKAGK